MSNNLFYKTIFKKITKTIALIIIVNFSVFIFNNFNKAKESHEALNNFNENNLPAKERSSLLLSSAHGRSNVMNSAPYGNFTNLLDGQKIEGNYIINLFAYDADLGDYNGDGIKKVIFKLKLDDKIVAENIDEKVKYNWKLNTTLYPDGQYLLEARIISADTWGLTEITKKIKFKINNKNVKQSITIHFQEFEVADKYYVNCFDGQWPDETPFDSQVEMKYEGFINNSHWWKIHFDEVPANFKFSFVNSNNNWEGPFGKYDREYRGQTPDIYILPKDKTIYTKRPNLVTIHFREFISSEKYYLKCSNGYWEDGSVFDQTIEMQYEGEYNGTHWWKTHLKVVPKSFKFTFVNNDGNYEGSETEYDRSYSNQSGDIYILPYDKVIYRKRISSSLSLDPNKAYKIISLNSNKCLDLKTNSAENGSYLYQWTYNNYTSQKWKLASLGNNNYTIIALNRNKVLEASTSTPGALHMWDYTGNPNQVWKIQIIDNEYFVISSNLNGKALSVSDSSTRNGALAGLDNFIESDNQLWLIQPADN